MKRLAIVGAGGHGRVVLDAARAQGIWDIWGFLEDDPAKSGTTLDGALVRGAVECLTQYSDEVNAVVVAVGNNAARLAMAARITEMGQALACIVHPSAVIASNVEIGPGTVVMAGAVIQPGVRVGSNAIINTAATVDHDCLLGDGVHLAPGVHVAGNVRVGNGAFLGVGAVVIPGVAIGDGAVVGAGSVVLKNVPPGATAYGVPARVAGK